MGDGRLGGRRRAEAVLHEVDVVQCGCGSDSVGGAVAVRYQRGAIGRGMRVVERCTHGAGAPELSLLWLLHH